MNKFFNKYAVIFTLLTFKEAFWFLPTIHKPLFALRLFDCCVSSTKNIILALQSVMITIS